MSECGVRRIFISRKTKIGPNQSNARNMQGA